MCLADMGIDFVCLAIFLPIKLNSAAKVCQRRVRCAIVTSIFNSKTLFLRLFLPCMPAYPHAINVIGYISPHLKAIVEIESTFIKK